MFPSKIIQKHDPENRVIIMEYIWIKSGVLFSFNEIMYLNNL